MESILENLSNLEISESCLEEILEKVFENIDNVRKEKIIKAVQQAKDGQHRTKALKILGTIQKRINASSKPKEDVKNSGITFTSKAFN